MKDLMTFFGKLFGKSFDENTAPGVVMDAVKAALDAKDTEISALKGAAEKDKPLIEEGKRYRQALVDDYARMKAALKECEEGEEPLKKLKGFATQLPIDFIEGEVKALKARMEEKFPAKGQLKGDKGDRTDGKENDNPLIPEEK